MATRKTTQSQCMALKQLKEQEQQWQPLGCKVRKLLRQQNAISSERMLDAGCRGFHGYRAVGRHQSRNGVHPKKCGCSIQIISDWKTNEGIIKLFWHFTFKMLQKIQFNLAN